MPVKRPARLTLRDRLSHLTYQQAGQWLGQDGGRLMRHAPRLEIDPGQVLLDDDLLQVTLPRAEGGPVVVTLKSLASGRDGVARRLQRWQASARVRRRCPHVAA